jgi:putative glycerol-1-phosphate prenyltransferase
MNQPLLEQFQQAQRAGRKQLAVLVDPDKASAAQLRPLVEQAAAAGVDYFFVGGSLLSSDALDQTLRLIKSVCSVPVVIFPGGPSQLSSEADGILLLSLISGRNPEFLIGAHVVAAPALRRSGLQILPTGYMLIDGGAPTTVSYISNTTPIPANKPDIAACTAMAGEQLGLRLVYLDAGSGAPRAIPANVISAVRKAVELPIIVGGGMRSAEAAEAAWRAGADVVVIGNALEEQPALLQELAMALRAANFQD